MLLRDHDLSDPRPNAAGGVCPSRKLVLCNALNTSVMSWQAHFLGTAGPPSSYPSCCQSAETVFAKISQNHHSKRLESASKSSHIDMSCRSRDFYFTFCNHYNSWCTPSSSILLFGSLISLPLPSRAVSKSKCASQVLDANVA